MDESRPADQAMLAVTRTERRAGTRAGGRGDEGTEDLTKLVIQKRWLNALTSCSTMSSW